MRTLAGALSCLLLVTAIGGLTGCNSIRTTPLDRMPDGSLVPNPRRPLKGVPVMLPVPTHIDVKIIQVDYWAPNADKGGELELITNLGREFENRHIITELVETNQMFIIDPKRPASGTGTYKFGFRGLNPDNPEYQGQLSSLGYKSEDTTITDSFALYGQIRTFLGLNTDASQEASSLPEEKYASTTRTIAFRRFPLNDDNVDLHVQEFVDAYMNSCNPGCYVSH
ncbi:MAG: hypothetical protein AAF456_21400 [Planctomycetota bacterium]